jgi:cold shock CspA family protein/uncharacterized LabA/DUF88 family protein
MTNDLIRIGIFYDGYYFFKVSNYYKYEHHKKSRISISGLHDYIRHEIAKIHNIPDIRLCQIIDAHYFKGRSTARELGEKVQSERIFEDILMRENIVTHYLPLKYNAENGALQEKGIDVWLALEAYELAIYKKFDITVLVAGDGDYVPLVRKLNTLGTQVMLICWDFAYNNENGIATETKTSRNLMEEVLYPIPMHERISNPSKDFNIDNLFVTDKSLTSPISSFITPQQTTLFESEDPDKPETSTILSLKDGFGFIRDEGRNNIFFHYSSLTNMDFDDLKIGMKVSYLFEEDAERSKRENTSCFLAYKVTVID